MRYRPLGYLSALLFRYRLRLLERRVCALPPVACLSAYFLRCFPYFNRGTGAASSPFAICGARYAETLQFWPGEAWHDPAIPVPPAIPE